MSKLSFDDLIFLWEADQKRNKVNVASSLAQDAIPTLLEKGLINEDGYFTDLGIKAHKKIMDFFARMEKGIPLEERVRNDVKKAVQAKSGIMGWVFGEYLKQTYCTNSDIILVGKPVKPMRAAQGLSSTRSAAAAVIKSSLAAGKPLDFVELHPFAFQFCPESHTQFLWMESHPRGSAELLQYAIQAMYYDYIMDRFPKASFYINYKKEEKFKPIQVRVTNRGWRNVVALIMPLDDTGMKVPNLGE
jgi:hypothetical protein